MITGDSKSTALAIARDVNVFSEEEFRVQAELSTARAETTGEAARGGGERSGTPRLDEVRTFTGEDFFADLSEEQQPAGIAKTRAMERRAIVFCGTWTNKSCKNATAPGRNAGNDWRWCW